MVNQRRSRSNRWTAQNQEEIVEEIAKGITDTVDHQLIASAVETSSRQSIDLAEIDRVRGEETRHTDDTDEGMARRDDVTLHQWTQ